MARVSVLIDAAQHQGLSVSMPAEKNKVINLALQGGGSHGAFTWGVLDRLLADERLRINGISGVSSGAMNAVILAQGLLNGGASGARDGLRDFWEKVSVKFTELFYRPTGDYWENLPGFDLFVIDQGVFTLPTESVQPESVEGFTGGVNRF